MNQVPENLPFDNSPWIIPIYKKTGVTSYDCIRDLRSSIFDLLGKGKGRRKLKIGHFGTLDPFAEGVLMIATGKALKLMQYFQLEMVKGYDGLGSLDHATDTGDCEGTIINIIKDPGALPELLNLQNAVQDMTGEYWQRPPYFSAVKHEGRPLYEWAREGIFIEKDPVKRTVYQFEILDKCASDFNFRCLVSSGTYIRGLWSDLSIKLGQNGHLKSLRRFQWGDIHLEDCFDGPENLGRENLKRPWECWVLPKIELNERDSELFIAGGLLGQIGRDFFREENRNLFWVYHKENCLGLGHIRQKKGELALKVDVNFVTGT